MKILCYARKLKIPENAQQTVRLVLTYARDSRPLQERPVAHAVMCPSLPDAPDSFALVYSRRPTASSTSPFTCCRAAIASSLVKPRSVIFWIDSFVIRCGWPKPNVELGGGSELAAGVDDEEPPSEFVWILFFEPGGCMLIFRLPVPLPLSGF
jgi:hypothetical protein